MSDEPFNWNDFMDDTNHLSLAAVGAWMKCLHKMRRSAPRGRISMPIEGYARMFGSTVEQAQRVLDELTDSGVPDHEQDGLRIVLINRRMRRAAENSLSHNPNQNGQLQPHPKLDIISSSKKNSSKEDLRNTDVASVFGFWQSLLGHPQAKLTIERRRAIAGRLSEGYSVEDLKRAIAGCKRSKYHMGQNEAGKVYDDIELICRNGSKVEQFQGYLSAKVATTPAQRSPGWTCQNCGNLMCPGCEEQEAIAA